MERARETGRAERSGWRVRKDGTLFWGEEVATALYDGAGELIGFSKITRDSTERRRAELERERLLYEATEGNRLKDEFLGTISHELRTPLNAILGWVQLIRMRQDTDRLPEALAVIERNARAQVRLIEDLLDVSRIVAGKTQLHLMPVVLAEALGAAVETVKPVAEQKHVALLVDHDVVEDEMVGDAQRLQQIIWNLLSNALKFTPAGGSVRVATCALDGGFELTIADSGVGIEPEFLPFVFDRFRQADTARTREHGGLGLGLSIVKHLVDLHGGRVNIDSAGRGQGTTVRLWFPRSNAARQAIDDSGALKHRERSAALTDVAVLVVDDDDDGRRVLDLILAAQGANVHVAATTSEALTVAPSFRPHVILADLAMPVEDGYSLLSKLRNAGEPWLRSVPVVAITAHARSEDRERALAAGFDAYVPKPFDSTDVIDLLARVAARSS